MPTPINNIEFTTGLADVLQRFRDEVITESAAAAELLALVDSWTYGTTTAAQLGAQMATVLGNWRHFTQGQLDWLTVPADGGPYDNGDVDLVDYLGNTTTMPGLDKLTSAAQVAVEVVEASDTLFAARDSTVVAKNTAVAAAGTATTQAGVATEKAGEASESAADAAGSAETAQIALDSLLGSAVDTVADILALTPLSVFENTYTLTEADNAKLIAFRADGRVIVYMDNLADTFTCGVIKVGTGDIEFHDGTGNIEAPGNKLKLTTRYESANIRRIYDNVHVLRGGEAVVPPTGLNRYLFNRAAASALLNPTVL